MPTPTLEDYDAFPLFSIALEDPSRPVSASLRRGIPLFELGVQVSPFTGWEPIVQFPRLWWWN